MTSGPSPSPPAPGEAIPGFDACVTPEAARALAAGGYWRDETLEAYLDRWATRCPDKLAAVDGAGRYTWRELARTAERVAYGLAAHGAERGSAIACQLPNWNEWVVLALAAARRGAVLTPIPPIYRASELRFVLNLLEARIVAIPGVFRGFDHVAMLAGLRADTPAVDCVFVARGTPAEGMRPFGALTDNPWESRRSKDIIIRGGENISPVEVENLLFAHPKVAAVAVVAMPDPRLQERACAFVIPKAGQSLTLAEVTAYLESRQVARQKFPERLELVSEFPMTPSGKISQTLSVSGGYTTMI